MIKILIFSYLIIAVAFCGGAPAPTVKFFYTDSCSSNPDCSSSPFGNICDQTLGQCYCNWDCNHNQGTQRKVCQDTGTFLGLCKECDSDGDCANNPKGKKCSSDYLCICENNTHCGASQSTNTCDTIQNTCTECLKDSDCSGSYQGGKCVGGVCGCTDDSQCGHQQAATSTCDKAKKTCAKCKTNADCKVGNCSNGICEECSKDSDCSTHKKGSKCLEINDTKICGCADNTQCDHAEAYFNTCNATQLGEKGCVQCTSDSQCSKSQTCSKEFVCVDEESSNDGENQEQDQNNSSILISSLYLILLIIFIVL